MSPLNRTTALAAALAHAVLATPVTPTTRPVMEKIVRAAERADRKRARAEQYRAWKRGQR